MGGLGGLKNTFLWKISPINLLGKAGFQNPIYRMVNYNEPFATAFIKHGDPAQRAVRTGIRNMFSSPKQSAYQPYNFAGMQQMMQQQSQNPAMMSVLQQNQKAAADSQARLAADLQAQNSAQQQNIRSQLAAADSSMKNFASKPAISVEYSFLPKSSQDEKTQLANKFIPPKISDITFGGI